MYIPWSESRIYLGLGRFSTDYLSKTVKIIKANVQAKQRQASLFTFKSHCEKECSLIFRKLKFKFAYSQVSSICFRGSLSLLLTVFSRIMNFPKENDLPPIFVWLKHYWIAVATYLCLDFRRRTSHLFDRSKTTYFSKAITIHPSVSGKSPIIIEKTNIQTAFTVLVFCHFEFGGQ